MSGNKQVIHVKDLVIKADNVHIEPQRRPHRDPFFGPRREGRGVHEESSKEYHQDRESSDHERHDDRGPFSWI